MTQNPRLKLEASWERVPADMTRRKGDVEAELRQRGIGKQSKQIEVRFIR